MKKKDISLLAIIVIISAVFSFFVSGLIVGDPESDPIEAEVVDAISSDFESPDDRFFNEDSFNPTQLIRVGDEEGNTTPFGQDE